MKVRRKTNQPSSQSVLQSLLVMFVSIWESKRLLKCFWLFYLSRPCFPGEIVGLLKTEMKQLSVMCLNILISRITRKKGLRKLVRNLRKSCVSFFWRSPVAVPKPVTAGSSLPVAVSLLLGPWAVCPQCGCPQHSPSSVTCACCSWGSLTYAILWLVQDIQYFTKTLSSGKQHLPVPRAVCVCSFLSWPQRWCSAINSCLQNTNEPLPLYSSWVQLPFSWHISSRG